MTNQAASRPLGDTGRQVLGVGLLALWLVGMSVVIVTFMVGHWYTLPKPDEERPLVAQAVAALRERSEQGRWLAVHVLYAECNCSKRIFGHLFHSERPAGVAERILLVGHDQTLEDKASAAGFKTEVVEPEALERRFHVQAAPLLLVSDPQDQLRYIGGYTSRKQGPDIRDREIIAGLRAEEPQPELPLFGCAVSAGLQQLLDPLGVKYRETGER